MTCIIPPRQRRGKGRLETIGEHMGAEAGSQLQISGQDEGQWVRGSTHGTLPIYKLEVWLRSCREDNRRTAGIITRAWNDTPAFDRIDGQADNVRGCKRVA